MSTLLQVVCNKCGYIEMGKKLPNGNYQMPDRWTYSFELPHNITEIDLCEVCTKALQELVMSWLD